MLTRLGKEERGVAMIVALMVVFVVLLLSTVVFAQAVHNSNQSAYDRKRLTSVGAAEAGLNYYYQYLQTTPIGNLSTAPKNNVSVGVSPGTATFSITPIFYQFSTPPGTTPFTGTPSLTNVPGSVLIKSVGTTNGNTPRTMESFLVLNALQSGFQGAVISGTSPTFSGNFTIQGSNGNDGDVFVLCPPEQTCDFTSSNNQPQIHGSLYVANGSINISTGLHLFGTAWASSSVTVDSAQAQIDGDLKASNAGVSIYHMQGLVGKAYYCTGSAPAGVTSVQTCSLGTPPTGAFPNVVYSPSWWAAQGYTNFQTFGTCAAAQVYIENTFNNVVTDPTVVRITGGSPPSPCPYSNSNNKTIVLKANLALVTDYAINLSTASTWTGSGGLRDLILMSPYPSSGTPNCTTPDQSISVGNSTNFSDAQIEVGIYSPCRVTLNNQNNFSGQVVGNPVLITNSFTLTYKPVVIPGSNVSGFNQDIAYIREIK